MSTSFSTSTFILKYENIPSTLYSAFKDLRQDSPYISNNFCNDPNEIKYIEGMSRNGWASWAIETIFKKFEANYLNFLTGKYARFRKEDLQEGCFEQISFLNSQHIIEETIKEFDSFFLWAIEHLEELAEISGLYSYDEIKDLILKNTISSFPKIDSKSQRDDEGDNLDYLFTYLRSIQAVLRYALKNNFAIAHTEDGEFAV